MLNMSSSFSGGGRAEVVKWSPVRLKSVQNAVWRLIEEITGGHPPFKVSSDTTKRFQLVS